MGNVDNFECAFEFMVENEGGYSNNINDLGGATKYGISLRFLESIYKQGDIVLSDINEDGVVDKEDIIEMEISDVKKLYKKYFWDPILCDRIKYPTLARKFFDTAVNFGSSKATKILQQSSNNLQNKSLNVAKENFLEVDGIIGKNTLAKVNQWDGLSMIQEFCKIQKDEYLNIIKNNPSQKVFEKGWLKRAERF